MLKVKIFTIYFLCIYVTIRFISIQIFIAFSCASLCCVIFCFMKNKVLFIRQNAAYQVLIPEDKGEMTFCKIEKKKKRDQI